MTDIINDEKMVFLALIDLLCSYCYNHRTTQGENTVESGWTICKLSSTLSYLDEFHQLSTCLRSFIRRVITYPLYRNFDLALQCIRDVVSILQTGKDCVLRCLLEMKFVLEHSQDRYLLCKLYIDDYAVWIQGENDARLSRIADEIQEHISKDCGRQAFMISEYTIPWLDQFAKECEERGEFVPTEQDLERPHQLE